MATNKERFPALVIGFRKAIYDQIKLANPDGKYIPTTGGLRAAAFPAIKEIIESEAEAVEPLLAINVWNAVMLTNESAFHQGMEREIKSGTLIGIKLVKGAKMLASQYNE